MNENGERAREEAWAMVALMVGAGLFGTLVGLGLDNLLGTGPWLLLVGALVGVSVGLFLLVRSGLSYAKREQRQRP